MCNNRDCAGDVNAPDKWACKACYGEHYGDPQERKDAYIEQKRAEKLSNACGSISRAVLEIESLLKGKVDREKLYGALGVNGEINPGFRVCRMLEGRNWKPKSGDKNE